MRDGKDRDERDDEAEDRPPPVMTVSAGPARREGAVTQMIPPVANLAGKDMASPVAPIAAPRTPRQPPQNGSLAVECGLMCLCDPHIPPIPLVSPSPDIPNNPTIFCAPLHSVCQRLLVVLGRRARGGGEPFRCRPCADRAAGHAAVARVTKRRPAWGW